MQQYKSPIKLPAKPLNVVEDNNQQSKKGRHKCIYLTYSIPYPTYYTVTCQNDRRHSSKSTTLTILLQFCDFRLEKIVLQENISLKFQVLRSNPLLADFALR